MARMVIGFPFEAEYQGSVSPDLALQAKCYNNMCAEAVGETRSFLLKDMAKTADFLERDGDVYAAWHLRDEMERFK